MTNPPASKVSGAAVLVIALAALVLAISPVAAARTAPLKAVQLALSTARAQLHTQHVDADFSLFSRRDPRWALVDGTATSRNRLWAAWLHGDSKGNWQLRYFDTAAPFQPSVGQARTCPLRSVPRVQRGALSAQRSERRPDQVRSVQQLAPTVSAAKIGTLLKNGGYSFSFKPPANGSLAIAWYLLPKGAHITAAKAEAHAHRTRQRRLLQRPRGKDHDRAHHSRQAAAQGAKTLKVTARAPSRQSSTQLSLQPGPSRSRDRPPRRISASAAARDRSATARVLLQV